MVRHIVLAASLAAGAAVPVIAQQDPPAPVVLGAARPLTAVEAASRLTGAWKLNEELSPVPRASSSPAAGAVPTRGGRGTGGGRGAMPPDVARQHEDLVERAVYREFTVRPQVLRMRVTVAMATFVDEIGEERTVTINNKKDRLDLGTSLVDSKTYWDGAALTIELDGGSQLRVFEIFELSPTGHQMLVTLKTANSDNPKAGQLRGFIQRVYDRVG